MQYDFALESTAYSLPDLLDRLSAPDVGLDPEYEELDREFAERRLRFANQ